MLLRSKLVLDIPLKWILLNIYYQGVKLSVWRTFYSLSDLIRCVIKSSFRELWLVKCIKEIRQNFRRSKRWMWQMWKYLFSVIILLIFLHLQCFFVSFRAETNESRDKTADEWVCKQDVADEQKESKNDSFLKLISTIMQCIFLPAMHIGLTVVL